MSSNRYFTRISYWHIPKNKLQEAIIDYVRRKQRRILTDEIKVIELIIKINKTVQDLNTHFKRCKPEKFLALRVETSNGDIDLDFGFVSLVFHSEFIQWDGQSLNDSEARVISDEIVKNVRKINSH